jgi:hypothetical protein
MTTFNSLRFEIPPTWKARSPYLYPPGNVWPSYTPGTGFLFVSSYDSQCYSGGNQPHLLGIDSMVNAIFCCLRCVFTGLLPSNGCPIVDSICFGNVFAKLLPSYGYICHNIYKHTHKYLLNTEVQFPLVPTVGSFTVICILCDFQRKISVNHSQKILLL